MTERELDELRTAVREEMTEKRYRHTLGVEKEMRFLAKGLAPALMCEAAAAALLHDVTKRLSTDEQLAYCRAHGLTVDADELLAPALLHAKTGAHFARTHFPALTTAAVEDAILRHTTAHPPLSLLAAMLFVADFTEEGRDYSDCVALRARLHGASLEGQEGMVHFKRILLDALDLSLNELIRDGRPIAMRTVEARNALLTNQLLF